MSTSPSATALNTQNHSSADCLLIASGAGINAAVIVGGAKNIVGVVCKVEVVEVDGFASSLLPDIVI